MRTQQRIDRNSHLERGVSTPSRNRRQGRPGTKERTQSEEPEEATEKAGTVPGPEGVEATRKIEIMRQQFPRGSQEATARQPRRQTSGARGSALSIKGTSVRCRTSPARKRQTCHRGADRSRPQTNLEERPKTARRPEHGAGQKGKGPPERREGSTATTDGNQPKTGQEAGV